MVFRLMAAQDFFGCDCRDDRGLVAAGIPARGAGDGRRRCGERTTRDSVEISELPIGQEAQRWIDLNGDTGEGRINGRARCIVDRRVIAATAT